MNARYVAASPRFAEEAQVARGPRSRLVRRAALAVVGLSTLALAAPAAATTEPSTSPARRRPGPSPPGSPRRPSTSMGRRVGGTREYPRSARPRRPGHGDDRGHLWRLDPGQRRRSGEIFHRRRRLQRRWHRLTRPSGAPRTPGSGGGGASDIRIDGSHTRRPRARRRRWRRGRGCRLQDPGSPGRPEVAAAESSVGPGSRPVVVQEQPAVAEERRPKGAAPRPQRRKATAASVETPLAIAGGGGGGGWFGGGGGLDGVRRRGVLRRRHPRAPSLRPGFAAATATSPSPTGSPPPPLPRAPRPTSPSAARSPTPRPSPTGVSPTGQITFRLYGPDDANCSGAPAFTDTKTVSGMGSYQLPRSPRPSPASTAGSRATPATPTTSESPCMQLTRASRPPSRPSPLRRRRPRTRPRRRPPTKCFSLRQAEAKPGRRTAKLDRVRLRRRRARARQDQEGEGR